MNDKFVYFFEPTCPELKQIVFLAVSRGTPNADESERLLLSAFNRELKWCFEKCGVVDSTQKGPSSPRPTVKYAEPQEGRTTYERLLNGRWVPYAVESASQAVLTS